MVFPLLFSVLTQAGCLDVEELFVTCLAVVQRYRSPEVSLPGNHLADFCGQQAPACPAVIILTSSKTLQPVHVKASTYPHDIQLICIMEQTAQSLYRLWQTLAGLWVILVADGVTALPGQRLLHAAVAQMFHQVVSIGLLPLHGVFPIMAGVMKQTGLDQHRYHVVGKCQCLRVVLLFTQLQYG